MDLGDTPHRRHDPLADRWVLVSPDRTDRPWQGREESPAAPERPRYDPACYLCPGNDRAGGATNPDYDQTFVFTNDFPSLRPDSPATSWSDGPLLSAAGEPGTCRVLCFHPRHDLTLARMSTPQVRTVVDLWAEQTAQLSAEYAHVQLFENRGDSMGASNPHPHGQVWATSSVPGTVATESATQRRWRATYDEPMLLRYVEHEAKGPRTVVANDDWLVVVPFWATWPFETLVLPRRPVQRLTDLDDAARGTLADALRRLLVRYDNLFAHPFPYSMGWHGAPGRDAAPHWQLHAHFYPPLLRSASVRKFMVGYEMLGEAQRDLTAEEAAARLRDLPGVHYLDSADDASGA